MNSKAITMIVASLVLGLAAVLVAARWVSGQSSVATAKVVVANKDLPIGSRLSADQLVVVDWPVAAAVGGSFSDPKMLDSRVINVSLQRGVPIMDSKLAPIGAKGGLSSVIAEGKRAMTVKVNEVVGVAGFALPGSLVDVVLSTQDQNATPISKIVLEKILVLAIAQEVGRDETKPKVVSAVTLEVTPAQAEKLDLGRSVGTLSLVLRNHFDQQTVATPGTRKPDLLGLPTEAPVRQVKTGAGSGLSARVHAGAIDTRPRQTIEVIRGIARANTEMGASE